MAPIEIISELGNRRIRGGHSGRNVTIEAGSQVNSHDIR
jgi:hypothetical protein